MHSLADYSPTDALSVLRWHYDVIGQPKSDDCPERLPMEDVFGIALGHSDPAVFECLCPALVLHSFDPARMLAGTPPHLQMRLRVACEIALFFISYSRLGIPASIGCCARVMDLRDMIPFFSMETDPWNSPIKDAPYGYYTPFFLPFGLKTFWPLADFMKQFEWAKIVFCHHHPKKHSALS